MSVHYHDITQFLPFPPLTHKRIISTHLHTLTHIHIHTSEYFASQNFLLQLQNTWKQKKNVRHFPNRIILKNCYRKKNRTKISEKRNDPNPKLQLLYCENV